jgi:hypothetical protein
MIKVQYPGQYSADGNTVFHYFTEADMDTVQTRATNDLLLAHAQMNASNYLGRMFIVRASEKDAAPLHRISVEIHLKGEDAADHLLSQLHLHSVVEIWAQRARIDGLRGDRFYAITSNLTEFVSDSFNVLNEDGVPLDDEDREAIHDGAEDIGIILQADVLLGSMILYNHRRATDGFGSDLGQVAADMQSLVEHILKVAPNAAVKIVTEHGDLLFGL